MSQLSKGCACQSNLSSNFPSLIISSDPDLAAQIFVGYDLSNFLVFHQDISARNQICHKFCLVCIYFELNFMWADISFASNISAFSRLSEITTISSTKRKWFKFFPFIFIYVIPFIPLFHLYPYPPVLYILNMYSKRVINNLGEIISP